MSIFIYFYKKIRNIYYYLFCCNKKDDDKIYNTNYVIWDNLYGNNENMDIINPMNNV